MSVSKKNAEGYSDPTTYEALTNIEKAEKKARGGLSPSLSVTPPLPLLYIASPFRGDTARNTDNAVKYCRYAVEQGKMPVAPHIWLPQFMNDGNPAEREKALTFGLWLLNLCPQVWVFGDYISDGMKGEIAEAKRLGKNVRYITDRQIKEWGLLA